MSKRRTGSRRPAAKNVESEPMHVDHIESGRALAFVVLQQYDAAGRFVTDLLAELDSEHDLSRQQRSQAIDVAAGTIRRRRTIDMLLQSQVKRPRAEVEPDLWRILQTGVQQLCFGRAPDHAAVDATVELTRSLDRDRWCGFVNGVLRNITRLLGDDNSMEPAKNNVPIVDGVYRQLNSDVFSCPLTAPVEYFGEAFSMPRAIARRWHQRLTRGDLLAAGFHSLNPPKTGMRVNVLRATVSGVVEALTDADVTAEPGIYDESLRLESAGRIDRLPGYEEGHWSIQDESAMAASRLLDPQPGEMILDLCAAPGGKTTHLAELSGDQATIYACDVNESRMQRVDSNVARLQLSSILSRLVERDGIGLPDLEFDAALVDVPCSNTGVLGRRSEARWRFSEPDLKELTEMQGRLLMTAFDRLRPGGRLVYSTCSIEPEETTDLIRSVVEAVPAMVLLKEQLSLPGKPADGAYTALIRRAAEPAEAAVTEPTL
jgi:16S rRNA (cytosine967-C5)-methyltransferase